MPPRPATHPAEKAAPTRNPPGPPRTSAMATMGKGLSATAIAGVVIFGHTKKRGGENA